MIKKGIYQHYKGKQYEVVGCGPHTTTGFFLVAYVPLYECEYELFFRPLEEFFQLVQCGDTQVPRFQLLHEKEFAKPTPPPVLPETETPSAAPPNTPGRPPKTFPFPKVVSG